MNLHPPRLGELDLDAEFDLRQHRVEAGIAGGGFQIGRRIAQPVHRGCIEIAGEQPDLEFVEHGLPATARHDRTGLPGPIRVSPSSTAVAMVANGRSFGLLMAWAM